MYWRYFTYHCKRFMSIWTIYTALKYLIPIFLDNVELMTVRRQLNQHLRRRCPTHDDVIKWKHFPRYWPFVRGIHRSPVNSPYKGQWRGTLMFFFICVWMNGWVNNREAGDLRRYRAHYDVTVMEALSTWLTSCAHSLESTGHRWIPWARASNAEVSYFRLC